MNGPENISQFLRVSDSRSTGPRNLRLNSAEVREYGLTPGQTVRGIVADDGRSVTLFSLISRDDFAVTIKTSKINARLQCVTQRYGVTINRSRSV